MSTANPGSTIDLTRIPRAVLSVALGVVYIVKRAVVGDAQIRTARGNAWEAICADRDRAYRRAEIRALVAALATAPPARPAITTRPSARPGPEAEPRPVAVEGGPAGTTRRRRRPAASRAGRAGSGRQPVS